MIDHNAHVQAYERYYAFVDLACQANQDPEALPVFGDALIESGWSDHRVAPLVYQGGRQWSGRNLLDHTITNSDSWFECNAATPTPTFVRAVVAVLLFKEWSTWPWLVQAPVEFKWRRGELFVRRFA